MNPVLPHITNEIMSKFFNLNEVNWPNVEKKFIETDKKIVVIQINGKKRNLIETGSSEKSVIDKIKDMKLIDKYLKDKKIFKTIFIKDRLINIIIKE